MPPGTWAMPPVTWAIMMPGGIWDLATGVIGDEGVWIQ